MRERPILFSGPMVREILAGRKTQTRRPVKNLRIRLRHEVSSDLPAIIRPVVRYAPGTYPAGMNPHGAVHVAGPAGDLGVKPQEFDFVCPYADAHTYLRKHPDGRMAWHLQVPEGQRLWVREAFSLERRNVYPCPPAWYRADFDDHELARHADGGDVGECSLGSDCLHGVRFKPGIHMPRKLSRLVLEVASVRVERLWAISEDDAIAEGMKTFREPRDAAVREVILRRWDDMYAGGDFACARNPWVWVVTFRRVDAARSAA
jgi:hypothetical protein